MIKHTLYIYSNADHCLADEDEDNLQTRWADEVGEPILRRVAIDLSYPEPANVAVVLGEEQVTVKA